MTHIRVMSNNETTSETGHLEAVPCFALIIRRPGQPDRRIVLDSLSDALAAAKADAAWLCGIGSVLVSPLLDVRRLSAMKG